jgi:3-phenylpropionate/cinnamic acid dioxygenase small subunit
MAWSSPNGAPPHDERAQRAARAAPRAVMSDDRDAIVDLISRYAHCVDTGDVDALVGCFTDDARVDLDGGRVSVDGRDAITSFYARALHDPAAGASDASTHLMSNTLVDLCGDDRAHAETEAVAYKAHRDRLVVVVRGLRYSDDCVRTGRGWRISHRVHRCLWQGEMELSGHAVAQTAV